jgi:hypothetical protein
LKRVLEALKNPEETNSGSLNLFTNDETVNRPAALGYSR